MHKSRFPMLLGKYGYCVDIETHLIIKASPSMTVSLHDVPIYRFPFSTESQNIPLPLEEKAPL